ncbi:MAG: DUF1573 domain-containing protein [Flavobacteriales bacterium]
MRNFLTGIFSINCFLLFAQNTIDVRISNRVVETDSIEEAGSVVSKEVYFTNFSTDKVWIKSSESACGCGTLIHTKDTLFPNASGSIIVTYNPAGRPGKFNKAFSITFTNGSLDATAHFSMQGYVIPVSFSGDITPDELVNLMRFVVYPEEKKRFIKTESFNEFKKQAARILLEDTTIYFSVLMQEGKKQKSFNSFKKEMKKQGIYFPPHKIVTSSLPKNDSFPKLVVSLVKLNPAPCLADVEIISESKAQFLPRQILPVYFQYLYNPKIGALDTTDVRFKKYIEELKQIVPNFESLKFVLVASASKHMNDLSIYKNNKAVAEKRLNMTKEKFFRYISNHVVELNTAEHILREYSLVLGPEYDYRTHLPKDFNYYQYLVIIPVIKTDFKIEDITLTNYKVNFDYRQVKLDPSSPGFIDFAKRIATLIKLQGYAEVSFESSSSHSKTMAYWRNDVMSYYRTLNTKIELEKLLEKLGVDPLKLIVTEEKLMVTGPKKPKPEDDLTPYQYVKISIID